MLRRHYGRLAAAAAIAVAAISAASAQTDPNSAPNPYRAGERWGEFLPGRSWGQVIKAEVDRDGKSLWIIERCGGTGCAGSELSPIFLLDANGKVMRNFGAGLFVFPHGLHQDRDGNIWASDAGGKDGIGHQVFKFSPEGNVLMTLGKKGVAGAGPDTFNRPSDVIVAPNGDIFVADGHGPESNARIVKFSAQGKFIKEWGTHGKGPGQFDVPHSLAVDSAGRLFVADRGNNRIQIFDQDSMFLAEWKQFGRPSGLFIDKNDMLYATDSESNLARNPGFKRGLRIGSVKDGKVVAFIPDPEQHPSEGLEPGSGSFSEGVTVDRDGIVYGAEVGPRDLKRYLRR